MLVLLLSACLAPKTDSATEALDHLRAVSRVPVVLENSRGYPNLVQLDVPAEDPDPVEAAYRFLGTSAALYGLSDARGQLRLDRVDTDRRGITRVKLTQSTGADRGDLPVFDSAITVHLYDGAIVLTSGRWVPNVDPVPPVLDAEEARDALVGNPRFFDVRFAGESALGVLARHRDAGADEVRTVWRSMVAALDSTTGAPVYAEIDVDAVTGEVVRVASDVSHGASIQIMYGEHEDWMSTCWGGFAGEDWYTESGQTSDYSVALDVHDGLPDAYLAWQNSHELWAWFNDTFGWDSYDNDGAQIEVVTHADEPSSGSASGTCGTIQLDDSFNGLDELTHEFTHLVNHNHGDLDSEGIPGALNESFGDVFSAFVTHEWTTFGRNIDDPPADGDPDHVSAAVSGDGIGLRDSASSTDDGFVHTNLGIPNKAAALITLGGTHNGWTLQGIGYEKAEQLYLSTLVSLESDSSFTDTRDTMVAIATYWMAMRIEGFTESDLCQVKNAWASVGVDVGGADTDCDLVEDASALDDDGDGIDDRYDSCPTVASGVSSDTDGDGIGDPCDGDIDGDGVRNDDDTCPYSSNADSADSDGDGIGDVCEDSDGDGIADLQDNCPSTASWSQADLDRDGQGDVCDSDDDADGDSDSRDNCPQLANADQRDGDRDGFGDVCDVCPTTWNPEQSSCDCAELPEQLFCHGIPEWRRAYVHPLDEVALPWRDVMEPGEERVRDMEVTIVGTTDVWTVVDPSGRVVATSVSERFAPSTRTATWQPSALVAEYTIVMSPALDPRGATIDVTVTSVGR